MAEQLGWFGEIDSSETLFSLQYFVTICLPILVYIVERVPSELN